MLPLSQASTISEIVNAVNLLVLGHSNNIGSVTLTLSSATTVVSGSEIHPGTVVLLSPIDSNASTESTYTVSDDGFFTIHHSNSGSTRTFNYVIVG